MTGDGIDAFIDMAVRLRVCLDRAWARLMAMPPLEISSMGTRAKACVLHDFWTEAVRDDFAGDDWAAFIEERGLKQLITECVRVRFKKVDRQLLAAGNRTRQSASWIQLPIPGVTPLLSLTFGYRPDALWSNIEKAGLTLQVGKTVPWLLEVGPAADDESDANGEMLQISGERPIRVKRHVFETRQEELFEETDDATDEGGQS